MAKVIYVKKDRIGYVTLNRPEALNALDDELKRCVVGECGPISTRTIRWTPPS